MSRRWVLARFPTTATTVTRTTATGSAPTTAITANEASATTLTTTTSTRLGVLRLRGLIASVRSVDRLIAKERQWCIGPKSENESSGLTPLHGRGCYAGPAQDDHGVQHVRDVERGEFQAGTLRDLLGLAVAVDLARAPDAPHVVREHKSRRVLPSLLLQLRLQLREDGSGDGGGGGGGGDSDGGIGGIGGGSGGGGGRRRGTEAWIQESQNDKDSLAELEILWRKENLQIAGYDMEKARDFAKGATGTTEGDRGDGIERKQSRVRWSL
ncbi:hypothetical protein G5I_13489 [Acromyrmex echinatior]|uniref:Uncharacterized protein n=1 Tax=Acromyrmex echinatior TaxID=103372 RepID=F4X564_ACREC|nr:hypothetical protein G5I_13489 [Acromyrmex echinatior]